MELYPFSIEEMIRSNHLRPLPEHRNFLLTEHATIVHFMRAVVFIQ